MLSQRSTSKVPRCRGMRSFLPRKPRERLIESPYNANRILFFYSSICSGAHPALHLSARCFEKCHRGSIIPTSKRLTSFEGTLRATRRKRMVQRYPRTDVSSVFKVYLNLFLKIFNLSRKRMMVLRREDTAVETTIVGERSR